MPGGIMMTMLVIATVVIAMQLFVSTLTGDRTERIYYSQFLEMLEAGEVAHVEVQPDRLIITLVVPDENGEEEALNATSDDAYEPEPTTAPTGNFFDRSIGGLLTRQNEQAAARPTVMYTGRMPDPELLARLQYHGVEYAATIITVN